MLRMLTAGESHGQALIAIIDGFPAGLRLAPRDLDRDLARRQLGYGRGGRMAIESDRAQVLSGVRFGETLGSPVAALIPNRDWANWQDEMAVWDPPQASHVPATCPRPGHADLAGALKYGHKDLRNVLERASARETAARVAAGGLAKALLREAGIGVVSQVLAIGAAAAQDLSWPPPDASIQECASWQDRVDESPVRCACPAGTAAMAAAIDEARESGFSLGGLFEVRAIGLPPGLGSHVQWDRRLDAQLAASLMSIQGVKGVEFGAGFELAGVTGGEAHDEIAYRDGTFCRQTNRAGGLEGGITNGEQLIARCAMKPIATQSRPLASVDLITKQPAAAHRERADVCAVPSAAVVAEAAIAFVLAGSLLEKCGGDSVTQVLRNLAGYLAEIRGR